MINNQKITRTTIRTLIERSFFLAGLTILIISIIAALYVNQRSLEERRDSNLQKIHEILSHLITPELTISDSTEIRRLLQLASNNDETFVVIDESGGVLMPDYAKIALVKAVIRPYKAIKDCENLHTVYRHMEGNDYWINCSILTKDNVFSENKNLGVLLSYSKYKWFSFSPMMFYFIGIAIITLLSIVLLFRQVLYRRLIRPLVILGDRIVDKAKSPLTSEAFIDEIDDAPCEVFAIKEAFEKVLVNLQAEYYQRTESEKRAVLLDLAAQVAHDIRSPLAVMEMSLMASSTYIPGEYLTMQREAIQSVRDIANNLLDRYRDPNIELHQCAEHLMDQDDGTLPRPVLLFSIVELIISQKKSEWIKNSCEINFSINPEWRFSWIHVSPNDLKRMLSNLLNNSYESLQHKREINLKLESTNNWLKLHVIDTGIGIPKDKINSALMGVSSKHPGKGLGLSNAKCYMEDIGGEIKLFSEDGRGSKVELIFPCVPKPEWFPEMIALPQNGFVVVLDDDASIHSLWRSRFQIIRERLIHFSRSDDFIDWCEKNPVDCAQAIFLMDYKLRNDTRTGLDLLEEVDARTRGYLVTSHADEIYIQKRVILADVWLIPKLLIEYIP